MDVPVPFPIRMYSLACWIAVVQIAYRSSPPFCVSVRSLLCMLLRLICCMRGV